VIVIASLAGSRMLKDLQRNRPRSARRAGGAGVAPWRSGDHPDGDRIEAGAARETSGHSCAEAFLRRAKGQSVPAEPIQRLTDATSAATPVPGAIWITSALALALIVATVLFHYEVLRLFTRLLARPGGKPRIRILYLVLGLFTLHTLEILAFAGAYYFLSAAGLGSLQGLEGDQFLFYFYYSAVVYTTLGFGDIIPLGPLKIFTAMEGLVGLGFITWSASFTFLEMQRYWRDT
jgi:hypothetical protein